ncbi:hypothetical protein JCGZ_24663 [Jatropha curcas]|uniref:DNA N(6)-methyladenine demethylase n=1 Tax=Jatropha curcas TaxID=180498 RepID=A0A067L996_JATCU|nr:uncharacterized protein LOC105631357 [Jatropha curcas]KDP40664.1 hypothetical protein JCGZ_24663 [Jatropha curcas]
MNRGRGRDSDGSSSRGGRSSRFAHHHSHRNRHTNDADGAFSVDTSSRRDGMSRGRWGNVHPISPGSFPRRSNHRTTQVFEYRQKKLSEDGLSYSESLQQDQNAFNVSDSEPKPQQLEPFVASDSASSLSAFSSPGNIKFDVSKSERATNGSMLPFDIKGKANTAQSQLSLQSGAIIQPFQEQQAKITESASGSGHAEHFPVIEPFDICLPKTGGPVMLKSSLFDMNRKKRNESICALEGQEQILKPGMVLLKGFLSTDDQVKIVKRCADLGLGPGGFYEPGYRDGAKLHLKMMCLGKNWDPDKSMYGERRPIDDSKPPDIPPEFHRLVEKVLKHSHAPMEKNSKTSSKEDIPWMVPDLCIVNFYSSSGRLGLHQDKDESEESLNKGLPVVSFSIGDAGEFLYSDNRDEKNAAKVLLESGDVLIFGGKSRHIFHGVHSVKQNTAPKSLLEATNLRPGRLNLTFRKY